MGLKISWDSFFEDFPSAQVLDSGEACRRLSERASGGSTRGYMLSDGGTDGIPGLRKASGALANSGPSLHVPTTLEEAQALVIGAGVPWADGYEKRFALWWASDERVDAMGDIVRQNWDFSVYQKNPVLLFSHCWNGQPIGVGIGTEVAARDEPDYQGPALAILGLLATAEASQLADQVHRLIQARILRAGSVGFESRKVIDVKNEDERAKLGLGRWGYVLDDNLLLEYSPTSIPANPGAVTIWSQAKQRGLFAAPDVALIRELARLTALEGRAGSDAWAKDDAVLRSIARLLFPRVEFCEHPDIEMPIALEEPRVLAGSVSVPVPIIRETDTERLGVIEGRLTTIEDAIAGLAAVTQEGFAGLAQITEDMRTSMEEMHGMLEQMMPDTEPETEGRHLGDSIQAGAHDRLARLLERVEACSQA